MSKRVNTVGIEIEPSAVHAAEVSVNGTIRVERLASVALDPGVVRDGEVTDAEALTAALERLYAENKGLGKRVRIGIANQKIAVRVMELPPIDDPKELQAAVEFKAPDEIPMPLDSAVMDFQPLSIVETPAGPRQRVLIVAARRDMVERIVAVARAAGLRPEGIDLAAFAMVRALHRPGDDSTTLYLSIGGLTNLAVAEGGHCLFTRVVSSGIESIAIELAERRGLTLEHARGWLMHTGVERAAVVTPTPNPAPTVGASTGAGGAQTVVGASATEPDAEQALETAPAAELDAEQAKVASEAQVVLNEGIRRIGGEVRNSLDFHNAQEASAATPVRRAVLTGAAMAVPGFAEALSAELGIPVNLGVIDGSQAQDELATVTIAAGLAVEEAPGS